MMTLPTNDLRPTFAGLETLFWRALYGALAAGITTLLGAATANTLTVVDFSAAEAGLIAAGGAAVGAALNAVLDWANAKQAS